MKAKLFKYCNSLNMRTIHIVLVIAITIFIASYDNHISPKIHTKNAMMRVGTTKMQNSYNYTPFPLHAKDNLILWGTNSHKSNKCKYKSLETQTLIHINQDEHELLIFTPFIAIVHMYVNASFPTLSSHSHKRGVNKIYYY
jgi:hypothetical protein